MTYKPIKSLLQASFSDYLELHSNQGEAYLNNAYNFYQFVLLDYISLFDNLSIEKISTLNNFERYISSKANPPYQITNYLKFIKNTVDPVLTPMTHYTLVDFVKKSSFSWNGLIFCHENNISIDTNSESEKSLFYMNFLHKK